jgi:hypothetical protein
VKVAAFEAALFEFFARTAGAEIVAPQLFHQFLVTMDEPVASLDGGFAVENPSGVCS